MRTSRYFKIGEIPTVLHRGGSRKKDRVFEKNITILEIRRAVEHKFSLNLNTTSNEHDYVVPRQIAWYLARTLTPWGLVRIGREIGQKHHTTVWHGLKKIEKTIAQDGKVLMEIVSLRRALGLSDRLPEAIEDKVKAVLSVPDYSGEWI